MDREIPKEVRNKERNKKIIRFSAIGIVGIIGISVLISLLRTGVQKKDLVFSTVDKGTIEVSVSASGKVVPAFEEIINSPINTRIVEVYRKGGDSVDVGTPILKLDLQSTETDYKKLLDEEEMKRYKLDQAKVNSQTKLSDMAMQIKVSEMKLARMKVELRNEQYLDSLGAGTTDKVRQAELSYNTSRLELEQLKQQYTNEKQIAAADLKVLELDLNMFRKGLAEMKRTLDDAQIRSPRKAILTYINNQIGAQIPQGGQVAIISDLSHFKVDGEIADTYGDRVAAGGKAIVKIGSEKLEGIVSSVTPLSKNGVISFSVQLKEDNNKRLRSGLKTDVYVMNAVKEDVLRIANASYYVGRAVVHNYGCNAWYVYTNLPVQAAENVDGEIYFGTPDGKLMHFSRQYRNDNLEPIDAYWESGSMDFDRDWRRKYSATLWVSIKPESQGRVTVTAQSNRKSDYIKKDIAAGLSSFSNASFAHWSFGTNRKPQVYRTRIKVKKFTFYKLIFASKSTSATATILATDFQVRYTGNVK